MNEYERVNYVKALMYIALADDTIEEGEEKYLDSIGILYGLSDEKLNEIKECILSKKESIVSVLENIDRREIQLILLYDLLALCYADDNYSPIEKQGMKNICDILKIESSKLLEMEQVMKEQIELQKKIDQILER